MQHVPIRGAAVVAGHQTAPAVAVHQTAANQREARVLFVGDLPAKTSEASLKGAFRGTKNVVLCRDRFGKSLRHAAITFKSQQARDEALLLSGSDLDGRPLIISMCDASGRRRPPLYLLLQKVPTAYTYQDVEETVQSVVGDSFTLIYPLDENEMGKGYAFVYVFSIAHYQSCLGLQTAEVNKGVGIEVIAGMFMGGRGRPRGRGIRD